MYGEISTGSMSEDFAPVHKRLQREWIFNAGFLSQSAIVFFFSKKLSLFSVKLVAQCTFLKIRYRHMR